MKQSKTKSKTQFYTYLHFKRLLKSSNRKQVSKIIKSKEFLNSLFSMNDYLNLLPIELKADIIYRVYKKKYLRTLKIYYSLFLNKDNLQKCKSIYISNNLKLTKNQFKRYLPFLEFNELKDSKDYDKFYIVEGITNRDKIKYFFNNHSPIENSFKKYQPKLYNYFVRVMKFSKFSNSHNSSNSPNSFNKIKNIYLDDFLYTLFRLSSISREKFVEFASSHKYPMRENQLKMFNFLPDEGLSRYNTAYKILHSTLNYCNECGKIIKSGMYSNETKQFCTKKCQSKNHYDKMYKLCKINDSELIKYNFSSDKNSNTHSNTHSKIKCNKCHKIFTRGTSNIFHKNNYTCNVCLGKYSKGQLDIFNLLLPYDNSLELEATSVLYNPNVKSQKRLDIYSSKNKFCIEFDGLMYHSFGISDHSIFNNPIIDVNVNKQRMVDLNKKDIQLFRVFDIEWLNPIKRNIWISMLKSKLNKTTKIYARNCEIGYVSVKDSKEFLTNNHMQGYVPGLIKLGLYHNFQGENKLVSLMTFGKTIRSNNSPELIRFCNLINTTVIGGASKLLNFFEKVYKPTKILSYANQRWSQGKLYETLGFENTHDTSPSYSYFKSDYDRTGLIFHRSTFTKSNIKKYFNENKFDIKTFDENLTETQNMFNNGYRKIYDCGNKVYVKKCV